MLIQADEWINDRKFQGDRVQLNMKVNFYKMYSCPTMEWVDTQSDKLPPIGNVQVKVS